MQTVAKQQQLVYVEGTSTPSSLAWIPNTLLYSAMFYSLNKFDIFYVLKAKPCLSNFFRSSGLFEPASIPLNLKYPCTQSRVFFLYLLTCSWNSLYSSSSTWKKAVLKTPSPYSGEPIPASPTDTRILEQGIGGDQLCNCSMGRYLLVFPQYIGN